MFGNALIFKRQHIIVSDFEKGILKVVSREFQTTLCLDADFISVKSIGKNCRIRIDYRL